MLLVQTVTGRYGSQLTDAWGWFLPTVMPTMSMMIGVVVANARTRARPGTVDRFMYRLALVLSALYLGTVALTILLAPLAEFYAGSGALELMKLSHLWLAPFQGLVAAALGVLFVKQNGGQEREA